MNATTNATKPEILSAPAGTKTIVYGGRAYKVIAVEPDAEGFKQTPPNSNQRATKEAKRLMQMDPAKCEKRVREKIFEAKKEKLRTEIGVRYVTKAHLEQYGLVVTAEEVEAEIERLRIVAQAAGQHQ